MTEISVWEVEKVQEMDSGNVCITSMCHFKMIKIVNFVMYVLLIHVQLFADPMHCSTPGFSVLC